MTLMIKTIKAPYSAKIQIIYSSTQINHLFNTKPPRLLRSFHFNPATTKAKRIKNEAYLKRSQKYPILGEEQISQRDVEVLDFNNCNSREL